MTVNPPGTLATCASLPAHAAASSPSSARRISHLATGWASRLTLPTARTTEALAAGAILLFVVTFEESF